MDNFEQGVIKFNIWFIDQHNEIVREIGKEGYMEYLHSLCCTNETSKEKEFLKEIKVKDAKWVSGDLPTVCEHKDLLDFALKVYNNRKVASKWNVPQRIRQGKP
eukprot:14329037-Ditylum_brightwellii.AAC.1